MVLLLPYLGFKLSTAGAVSSALCVSIIAGIKSFTAFHECRMCLIAFMGFTLLVFFPLVLIAMYDVGMGLLFKILFGDWALAFLWACSFIENIVAKRNAAVLDVVILHL